MKMQNGTLPSGLKVITVSNPDVKSAGAAIIVPGGTGDETVAENGIAHFLEHMAFKGTTSRSALDIARTVEICGSDMNAHTSMDETAYYISGLDNHLPTAISILSDIVSDPILSPADIDMECGVIQQEIKRAQDNPQGVCWQLLSEVSFPGHVAARAVLGTHDSVARFQAEDFRAFIARQYALDNMYIVAGGNVRHDEVVQMFEERLAGMPAKSARTAPPPVQMHHGVAVDRSKPFEQVTLMMSLQGVAPTHPDRMAFKILCNALGGGMSSPIFQEIREKRGLVYSVGIGAYSMLDSGQMILYAGTTGDKVEELLRVGMDEIRKVSVEGVHPDDLERAKNGGLVGLATLTERPMRMAMTMASRHMTHGTWITIPEMIAKIEAVTMEDVKRVAAQVVQSKPSLAMVGPAPDLDYEAILAA